MISFFDNIKVFFLFICFLYAFIPFENVTIMRTDQLHLIFIVLIIIYALYMNSFKLYKFGILFLMVFIFIAAINSFVSIGHDIVLFSQSVIFASIIVPIIYHNNIFREQFVAALRWLIIVSIIMFFVQFFVYKFSGNLLLLHEFVFPFSSARIAEEGMKYDNIVRMGGMYIEPGTYANFMYIYMMIYIVLTKKLSDPILFIGAISAILTFSVWGIMFYSYFFFLLILNSLKYLSLVRRLFIVFIIALIGYSTYHYLENDPVIQYSINKLNSNSSHGSTGNKKEVYDKFLKTYDESILVGEGFIPEFKNGTEGMQDSGVLLNLAIILGKLFALVVAIIFIFSLYKSTSFIIALMSLPIFMDKIYYWDAAFIFLLFLPVYNIYFNYQRTKT